MSVLTRAERRFGGWMGFVSLGSVLLALALCVAPDRVCASLVSLVGWCLPGLSAVEAGASWAPLLAPCWVATGMCAAMVAIDPRQNRPFALPFITGHGVAGVILLYLGVVGSGLEWIGLALVESAVCLVTTALFYASVRAVNGSWLRGGPPGRRQA